MSLCNKKYTAMQYALLSSLTALGRIYVGPVSGHMVEAYGWAIFYGFSALIAIPGLLLLMYLRKQIEGRDVDMPTEPEIQENVIQSDNITAHSALSK
jgi:PAT family beta-lactamase induction signal transducer AmpG